jgi:hypothetical protein
MEGEGRLYQGQERGVKEKAAWYTTALGIGALLIGVLGNNNRVAAIGLGVTALGLFMGAV